VREDKRRGGGGGAVAPKRDCDEAAYEQGYSGAGGCSVGVGEVGEAAGGPQVSEHVLEQGPLGDAEGGVDDVVEHLVEAEDAAGEEGAVGPFEPVQRDVPECSVAVGEKQPEGEAVGEEGEGDWSGGGGA
jgi:hypothetical protein